MKILSLKDIHTIYQFLTEGKNLIKDIKKMRERISNDLDNGNTLDLFLRKITLEVKKQSFKDLIKLDSEIKKFINN